ncbi:MAG: ATP-binding protein [Acidimicrobiia bacterium]|nr:ATP-binding protein [Acidimicrobiia bacterium]
MTFHGRDELIIPATPVATRLIGPWLNAVLDLGHEPDPASDLASRAELALVEHCNNVALHGYAGDEGSIRLVAQVDDDGLTVTVIDSGVEFDPRSVADPDEVQVHGYGLMIIRKLTDEFDMSRENDSNHWRLRFSAPPGAAGVDRGGKVRKNGGNP